MKIINGLAVLDNADFSRVCPSFYAETPKPGKTSPEYAFINSRNIAVALWGMGWYPVKASESKSRDESNRGFTKHMIRFANRDLDLGTERIELCAINSHNCASAFKFFMGIFRKVCSNGLVVQTGSFGNFSIRHFGDIRESVEFAVREISGQANRVSGLMNAFRTIDLTRDEQGVYAQSALEVAYPDTASAPITAPQLLIPRRDYDRATDREVSISTPYSSPRSAPCAKGDLWTTFNIVQENLIKGGLRGRSQGETRRQVVTRGVSSIDRDVKLNQTLWALTERMAALKGAAPAAQN